MNGVEKYNDNFDTMARKRIEKSPYKKYLDGVYNYMLADTSYSGAYGYLGCIINFLNYSELKNLNNINVNTYTKYLSSIKGKSSSYRIMVYSGLKKFSSYLMATGVCDDYMKYIKRPKFKESTTTKEKREIGFMEPEEVKKFLDTIKNSDKDPIWKSRDYAMALVLLSSGIRCSALYKLDTRDLNLNKGTITVLEKGENSREIYLSDSAMDAIKEWLYNRSIILGMKEEDALFISNHKKRINERTIYGIIKNYGAVIDGKHITPHKTRATYGTQLYNQTHDLYFVQECMGHSNPKTTEIYIRGQKKEASRKAASLMDSLYD